MKTLAEQAEDAEQIAIIAALRRSKGHVGKAAGALGVSRRTLEMKMKRHELRELGRMFREWRWCRPCDYFGELASKQCPVCGSTETAFFYERPTSSRSLLRSNVVGA